MGSFPQACRNHAKQTIGVRALQHRQQGLMGMAFRGSG